MLRRFSLLSASRRPGKLFLLASIKQTCLSHTSAPQQRSSRRLQQPFLDAMERADYIHATQKRRPNCMTLQERRFSSSTTQSPADDDGRGEADPPLPSQKGPHDEDASLDRFRESLREASRLLQCGLVEREEVCLVVLLALVTGSHLFLLGPPGTAKSEIARRLAKLLQGRFFERLLTPFSLPEEVFGPYSLSAIAEGRFERLTDKYLPTAEFAFLDEIFKANSSILNSLLTILNEREFDNGTTRMRVPLRTLISASNEVPVTGELRALSDRFLLRCYVDSVSVAGFEAVVRGAAESERLEGIHHKFTAAETQRYRSLALLRVNGLNEEIVDVLKMLRQFLKEQDILVSDRRWRQIGELLKVVAYTSGRLDVTRIDLCMLKYCCWETMEQVAVVEKWLIDNFAAPTYLQQGVIKGLARKVSQWQTIAKDGRDMLTYASSIRELLEEHFDLGEHGTQRQLIEQHQWLSHDMKTKALKGLRQAASRYSDAGLSDIALTLGQSITFASRPYAGTPTKPNVACVLVGPSHWPVSIITATLDELLEAMATDGGREDSCGVRERVRERGLDGRSEGSVYVSELFDEWQDIRRLLGPSGVAFHEGIPSSPAEARDIHDSLASLLREKENNAAKRETDQAAVLSDDPGRDAADVEREPVREDLAFSETMRLDHASNIP
mmetsp:Transcript_21841/g.62158  ORF Transcript_21841/g.62158 Transcript_21841/m.62158 type:complete len:670 (+) Transcript_21841:59-2068(+)